MVVNHLAAPSATTSAQYQVIWTGTKWHTQVTSHSAAPSVATNAQHQVLWRPMKRSTLAINHSAAPIVTINAQGQVNWRNTKESTLVQLLSMWLQVRNIKWFEQTKHKRIHTGDKPFGCSQCDYNCTQRRYLNAYERTHTSDKPFTSLNCDKKFTVSQYSRKHASNYRKAYSASGY